MWFGEVWYSGASRCRAGLRLEGAYSLTARFICPSCLGCRSISSFPSSKLMSAAAMLADAKGDNVLAYARVQILQLLFTC